MTNNSSQDFGFGGDEFKGELSIVPYAQFLNSNQDNYGIAITSANAELASFELIDNWQPVEHEFRDGAQGQCCEKLREKFIYRFRCIKIKSSDKFTL
jgi:hypothetical protein